MTAEMEHDSIMKERERLAPIEDEHYNEMCNEHEETR